jgi:hypothetical protein
MADIQKFFVISFKNKGDGEKTSYNRDPGRAALV